MNDLSAGSCGKLLQLILCDFRVACSLTKFILSDVGSVSNIYFILSNAMIFTINMDIIYCLSHSGLFLFINFIIL